MRLTAQGQSLRAVRAYIEQTYSGFGPGTSTPWPPD